MNRSTGNSDRYLATAYTHCQCDKYSLTTLSFRQWHKRRSKQFAWTLDTCSPSEYAKLWEQYARYVQTIRKVRKDVVGDSRV